MSRQSLVRASALLLAAGACLPSLRAADIPAAQDTFISPAAPGTNFGSAVTLNIAPGNVGLVQFDLSSIPVSGIVAAAYLKVYVNKVTAAGSIGVCPVTSSWSESLATFPGPAVGATVAVAPVAAANAFVLVDVTAVVNAGLASPATNFGICITGVGATTVFLDSKENTATSHPPELDIALRGAAGPAGPGGAKGPAGATGATGPAGPGGAKGPTGATGATGPVGATGAAGATGAQGLAGAAGPGGATGPVGPTGATGATGAQGLAGAAGPGGATGPVGPTGATGPAGAVGLAGAAGPVGATGPAGPQGVNGPSGNLFNMDPTLHPAAGYTIPDTDTFMYYRTNNPTMGGTGNFTLPHAAASGRRLVVIPANASVSTTRVQIAAQTGDTIFYQTPAGQSSMASIGPIMLFSDGNHRWYVIATQ